MLRHVTIILTLFLAATLALPAQEPSKGSGVGKAGAEIINYFTKPKQQVISDSRSQFYLSTNLFDWVDFATINLDFGMPVAQRWSLVAGAKFNPWTFKPTKGDYTEVYNHQMSFSLGARFWPWYVNSGWWACAKVQYTDYAITGVWRPALDTGKGVGLSLSVGYCLMINKHINLDFGGGFWAGRMFKHTVYQSIRRMEVREDGPMNFIAINDITIGIQYLF